ncbi:hypothetical protein PCANC_01398 [Puccinia coronata f. sp. avenae]|uniref:Transcription factor BYE1 n=1 Tax=Puccinia coronata f. sp. avenae TaxID=200324 RepID=A0A2N5W634_9BASI|nr:hypothetical protein PCANC_01398 [Puccinia coronata f. sp. avenae]
MNRSSRIRKPSQKAREIAEAALLLSAKSTPSSSADQPKNGPKLSRQSSRSAQGTNKISSSVRAKVKIGRKKGRATINSNGDVDVEVESAAKLTKRPRKRSRKQQQQQQQQPEEEEEEEEVNDDNDDHDAEEATPNSNDSDSEEDPDVLYCICLGHDDHTPMIQCEGCENWFHFSCISLDPTEAQKIEAFYCQLCNASGNGITRKIDEESATTPAAPDSSLTSTSNTPDLPSENPPGAPPSLENTPMSLTADSPPHLPSADPVELKPEEKPASELKPEEAPSEPKPLETAPPSMPSSQEIVTQIICDSKDKPAEAPNCPSVDSVVQPPQSTKTTRRKQRLAEGLSSEGETSDEDFTGEEYLRTADKKRKTPTSVDSRPSTQPRISASTPSSTTPSTPTTPVLGVEKTRKACAEQFFKLFEPIFSKNMKQDEHAAMRFSEAVESELYESFGELDARNQKVPRRQYMAKLRSLLFNLKNNPAFLNSLSSLELSPKLIVFMSNEDLQTPEQKALAEQVRQRSLQDSVKTLDPVLEPTTSPKADGPILSSLPPPKALGKPLMAVDHQPTLAEQAPFESDQLKPDFSRAPVPPSVPQVSAPQPHDQSSQSDLVSLITPHHVNKTGDSAESVPAVPPQSEKSTTKCLTPNLLSSFDLEKVFAAIKSVPPPPHPASANESPTKSQSAGGEVSKETKDGDSDDCMDLENTPEREVPAADRSGTTQTDAEKSLPDDYDPFVLANGVDADLEAILHGDQLLSGSPIRPTGLSPTKESESQSAASAPMTPSVWTGNVMTADAGGFAACAAQVGGRPLSPDGLTWSKIIPTDTMTVVGRLPVKESTTYLVQSHFAPSRELVLLELRPNLKGPPELPSPERVIQHQQNLIEFFTKKGRHAVVAVNEKVKQAVRDIYLVPILRQDPLPEFVQLLDDVSIPEATPRAKDMMVAVLVLSKGAVPSAWKSTPPNNNNNNNNPLDPSNSSAPAPIHHHHHHHHHQAQAALPSTSSAQSMAGAAQLLSSVSNQGMSPAPLLTSSSYPLPPPQQTSASSAHINPIPLLQSLSSKISSVSSQLSFPLLSHMSSTSSVPAANISGPPPGFVPYVQPEQPKAPSVPPLAAAAVSQTPSLNGLDLSKVDVSALQALLSSQQALTPIINQAQSSSHQATNAPVTSTTPPSSSMNQNGRHPSRAYEARNNARPGTLPTAPRQANLPLNPHFVHPAGTSVSSCPSPPPGRTTQQYSPPAASGWPAPDQARRPLDPYPTPVSASKDKTPRKGLMRMGDVIRPNTTPEDHRRRPSYPSSGSPQPSPSSSFQHNHNQHQHHNHHHHPHPHQAPPGRAKRNSHEFVAPPRDGGWAGRGRGKKLA